jgi:hypothetical protein
MLTVAVACERTREIKRTEQRKTPISLRGFISMVKSGGEQD